MKTPHRDLRHLVLGRKIGSGCYRTVYEYALDLDRFVIKEEADAGNFCNVLEWEVWQSVCGDKDVARWLAPCESISANGIYLVQRRTEPIPKRMLPKFIPNFLTDINAKNWGLLDGKPVCHDYAFISRAIGLACGAGKRAFDQKLTMQKVRSWD